MLLFLGKLGYNEPKNNRSFLELFSQKTVLAWNDIMLPPDAEIINDNDKKPNKNNGLNELLSHISPLNSTKKIPPLDKWSPTAVHDFDIVIKDNDDWYHEGIKMTRQSLVELFASVLWGEQIDNKQEYFLKTPSNLYRICVEDAPLLINRVDEVLIDGGVWIVFGTSTGDQIILDDKPLYFKDFLKNGQIENRLYIDTRFGLTARISANVLYHLIQMGELSEQGDKTVLTLTSGGRVHQVVAENSCD